MTAYSWFFKSSPILRAASSCLFSSSCSSLISRHHNHLICISVLHQNIFYFIISVLFFPKHISEFYLVWMLFVLNYVILWTKSSVIVLLDVTMIIIIILILSLSLLDFPVSPQSTDFCPSFHVLLWWTGIISSYFPHSSPDIREMLYYSNYHTLSKEINEFYERLICCSLKQVYINCHIHDWNTLLSTSTYGCMQAPTHPHVWACVFVLLIARTHVCTSMCAHARVCTHTHTRTLTHTHSLSLSLSHINKHVHTHSYAWLCTLGSSSTFKIFKISIL